MKICCNSI